MAQDKEQRILKAATQVFLKEGFEKTSMRRIATEAGMSVGTLYLYYKNKDELFYAVQHVAFDHFLNYLKPLMDIENPADRLKKLGETYLFFALQNPDYYDLMFIMNAPMNAVEETKGWRKGEQLFNVLYHTIQECIEKGYTKEKDADALALVFWSSVHGMVSLVIKDRLDVMKIEEAELLLRKVHNLLIGKFLI